MLCRLGRKTRLLKMVDVCWCSVGDSDVRRKPMSTASSSNAAAAAANDTQQPHPLSDEDQQMVTSLTRHCFLFLFK